jgi:hypothetical protein
VSGYRIYRGSASGNETLLVTVGDVLGYTDAAVSNGSTYWYQVAAVSARARVRVPARSSPSAAPLLPPRQA